MSDDTRVKHSLHVWTCPNTQLAVTAAYICAIFSLLTVLACLFNLFYVWRHKHGTQLRGGVHDHAAEGVQAVHQADIDARQRNISGFFLPFWILLQNKQKNLSGIRTELLIVATHLSAWTGTHKLGLHLDGVTVTCKKSTSFLFFESFSTCVWVFFSSAHLCSRCTRMPSACFSACFSSPSRISVTSLFALSTTAFSASNWLSITARTSVTEFCRAALLVAIRWRGLARHYVLRKVVMPVKAPTAVLDQCEVRQQTNQQNESAHSDVI